MKTIFVLKGWWRTS
ncbi:MULTISPECIES: trp operon leader peptide [Escherichia]|nr:MULTISPECIES: trp operon leader peptide [Escherichia]EFI2067234.1 trp operon leader peptide [Escherichia coli]EHK3152155.1 trp operon leader peptide [Escherichia coli]EMB1257658.1 trp operon leader peptide [Escherichia coli]TBR67211.1 trp operon leader peptide [Escherichia sp. E10V4]TLI70609.1 trp operon leader peptide [Escherichia sp. E2586]